MAHLHTCTSPLYAHGTQACPRVSVQLLGFGEADTSTLEAMVPTLLALPLTLTLTLALSVGQENRYRCEKCRQLVRARKQLTLHTPPRHLTVQVTLPLAMLT